MSVLSGAGGPGWLARWSSGRAPSPRMLVSSLGLAALLVLQGCATTTDYARPAVTTPTAWAQRDAGSEVATPAIDTWWRAFNDPALTRLVEGALARNNDLAAAAWKVREARLNAGLAANKLWPSASAGASNNVSTPLNTGTSRRSSGADVSLSYEVDMWNRLANTRDAQTWEAEATEQDRQSAAQALAGTVAGLYWQIAYQNGELASTDASLEYARRTLALVQAQYKAGTSAQLELREAEASVASQLASRTLLVQQRTESRNALAILFDAPPGEESLKTWLDQEPQFLPLDDLPAIATGLPADMLARRPDLRAAEMRLRETLAFGDASRAAYYPSLTLTGSLGTSSSALLEVLRNPVLAIGVGLSLPFVRYQEMKLNTQLTEAQYQQAVINFRQTLYTAFSEVENSLSARRQYAERAEHLTVTLDAQRNAERLYEVRYRSGGVALQPWLDAQERRRSAELSFAANRLQQLTTQATLYQALGGNLPLAAVEDLPVAMK